MNRSKKSFIIWMLMVVLFCCSGGSMLNSVQALKNQGKVMMSSQTAHGRNRKTKMFVLDNEDHVLEGARGRGAPHRTLRQMHMGRETKTSNSA